MNRVTLVLTLLLMLPALPASATHVRPGDVEGAELPNVPEESPGTGIIPVDERVEGVEREANNGIDVVQQGQDDAIDASKGLDAGERGALRLFDEPFGGDRHGGFGDWQILGNDAWAQKAGVGQAGAGYTTGVKPDGTYPALAASVLVSPEFDLHTGLAEETSAPSPSPYLDALGPVPTPGVDGIYLGLAETGELAAATYDELVTTVNENPLRQLPPAAGTPAAQIRAVVIPALQAADDTLGQGVEGGQSPEVPPLPVSVPRTSPSRLLFTLYQGLAYGVNRDCYVAPQGCTLRNPGIQADVAAREGATLLQFAARHNLGSGRDLVGLLVFTEEPTVELVQQCHELLRRNVVPATQDGHVEEVGVCSFVSPLERDPAAPTWEGYTGFSNWQTQSIDLTPWVGRSAWVAWVFLSDSTPGNYFQSTDFFSPTAGFYGFALDNVTLTTPAAPQSMRVRPLREPSTHPGVPPMPLPTIAIDAPFDGAVDVMNMGLAESTVGANIIVLEEGERVGLLQVEPVALPPGSTWSVPFHFEGLTDDPARYTINVSVVRTTLNDRLAEADTSDDVQSALVDVADVRSWTAGDLERATNSILVGQDAEFTMKVHNLGNVPVELTAAAQLVEVFGLREGIPVADAQFTLVPNPSIPLAPSATEDLVWRVRGTEAGTYRLFARVDDKDAFDDAAGFDAMRDLVPEDLQPRRVPFAPVAPTIDGVVGGVEWGRSSQAVMEWRDPAGTRAVASGRASPPGSDSGAVASLVRMATNGTHLFLGFNFTLPQVGATGAGLRGITLFVDDGADGIDVGVDRGVSTRKGGFAAAPRDQVTPGDVRFDFLDRPTAEKKVTTAIVSGHPDVGQPLQELPDSTRLLWAEKPLNTPVGAVLDLDNSDTVSAGDYRFVWGNRTLDARDNRINATFGGFIQDETAQTAPAKPVLPCLFGGVLYLVSTIPTVAADCEVKADENAPPNQEPKSGDLRLDGVTTPFVQVGDPRGVGTTSGPMPGKLRFRDLDLDGRFGPGDSLYIDMSPLEWQTSSGPGWANATTVTSGVVNAEFAIPFGGRAGGLQAGLGDQIRLLAVAEVAGMSTSVLTEATGYLRMPAGRPFADGQGFTAADGSLDDEVESWMPLRLPVSLGAEAAGDDNEQRRKSNGFGVDRAPPPLVELDLGSSCDGLHDWFQTGQLFPWAATSNFIWEDTPRVDKWSCAPYGSDGKVRLVEGVAGGMCSGEPCKQSSWVADEDDTGDREIEFVRESSLLYSPPIKVPQGVQPYLFLRHQYSTAADVNDGDAVGIADRRRLELDGGAQVFVQRRVSDGEWGPLTLVVPEAGLSSKDSTGLEDLRLERDLRLARAFGDSEDAYTLCPGADKSISLDSTSTTVQVPSRNCAWWWPTGFHQGMQNPQDDIPLGGDLHGSPWVVDRLPLFGAGHGFKGDQTLELEGETVRLVFSWQTLDTQPDADVGWRIEGLAVTEGRTLAVDVGVVDVALPPAFAPLAQTGLAPGLPIPLAAAVVNSGSLDAPGVRVDVRGLDPLSGATYCSGSKDGLLVPAGSSLNVSLDCLPSGAAPDRVVLLAEVSLASGRDDFPADNRYLTATPIPLRSRPDAAALVEVSPADATRDEPRTLRIALDNRGNVPLEGLRVEARVLRGAGQAAPETWVRAWDLDGILPVGSRHNLTDTVLDANPQILPGDLSFQMTGLESDYQFIASVVYPEDWDTANDAARTTFRGLDAAYGNKFDGLQPLAGAQLDGTDGVWAVAGNSEDGTRRLVAGDPATGEVPQDTDAWAILPLQDLRSLQGATLTFRHRFDLEEGFDAGRVEVSTDGGASWRPLRPEPEALGGLPRGYSSAAIEGNDAFPDPDRAGGIAFTGRSADLPGSNNGWITSAFDLGQDAGLSREAAVVALALEGMKPVPVPLPTGVGPDANAFLDPSWAPPTGTVDESWWIQNLTYDAPRPHSGETMWWSGTAGEDSAEHPLDAVRNELTRQLQFTSPARPEDTVLATWWEWQAGGADGGTGAAYTVMLDGVEADPVILATDPSGWRQAGIDVTDRHGSPFQLSFRYESAPETRFNLAKTSNNRGWHIDDLQVLSFERDERQGVFVHGEGLTVLDDLEALQPASFPQSGGSGGGWTAALGPTPPGALATDVIGWGLTGAHASPADGGWHIEPENVPGRGQGPAWSFSAGNEQGYPHGADARLVTPFVDLDLPGGGDLTLRFDQRYWLESRLTCPLDADTPISAQDQKAAGCFLDAIDAGAVEVQERDVATGAISPWRQLAAEPGSFPGRLLFHAEMDDCASDSQHKSFQDDDPPATRDGGAWGPCTTHHRYPDRLSAASASRTLLDRTGYPGIEFRGGRGTIEHDGERCGNALQGPGAVAGGQGTSFQAFDGLTHYAYEGRSHAPCPAGTSPVSTDAAVTLAWTSSPVSYVFTGDSGGWQDVRWNVTDLAGKQVRFAWHAFSDPGYLESPDDPPRGERGWDIANVQVAGQTFQGKPTLLRWHVATDGSLTKGEWSIDNVTLVGQSYTRNPAILPAGPTTLALPPGETAVFPIELANLGATTQVALAVGLVAMDDGGKGQPFDAVEVSLDDLTLIQLPSSQRPAGVHRAWRLGDLAPGDVATGEVRVVLPAGTKDVGVHLALFELGPDGYWPARGDAPGNLALDLLARGLAVDDVRIAAPPEAGDVELAVVEEGGQRRAQATVINLGTTEPDVRAQWSLWRVEHRGGTDQPSAPPVLLHQVEAPATQDLGTLARGASIGIEAPLVIDDPGMYRLRMRILDGATVLDEAQHEFLAGANGAYASFDFQSGDATALRWSDRSPPFAPGDGGSPPSLRFRDLGPALVWGVTEDQFAAGTTYCKVPDVRCEAEVPQGSGPGGRPAIGTVRGLEGVAIGPPIDLTAVPQGEALVTLRHSHVLESGDGARVELMPVTLSGPTPRALFICGDGITPMAFVLDPDPASEFLGPLANLAGRQVPAAGPANAPTRPAQAIPDRIHPLAFDETTPGRGFGEAANLRTTAFHLDGPLTSTCPDAAGNLVERDVVNYVVQPILRLGTTLGYVGDNLPEGDERRTGALGWQVQALRVASSGVELEDDERVLRVRDGLAKTFLFSVRNVGQVPDAYEAFVVADDPADEQGWLHLPAQPLALAAGREAALPVTVDIPTDPGLQRGDHSFRLVVRSASDPGVLDTMRVVLRIGNNALPDLVVGAALEDEHLPPQVVAGSIQPVHVTVNNLGRLGAGPVEVSLEAIDVATGARSVVDTAPLPPLCPRRTCGDVASRVVVDLQWPVPATLGQHRLEVVADADGRLLEEDRSNNLAVLDARVVSAEIPDVAVTALRATPTDASKPLAEGDFVSIVAEVSNLGPAPAGLVLASLLYNGFPLGEPRTLAGLPAGGSVELAAVTSVLRGEAIITVTLAPLDGIDANPDNNELSILLRVRGHGVTLELDSPTLQFQAGGMVTLGANVTNSGDAVDPMLVTLEAPPGWALAVLPNPIVVPPNQTLPVTLQLRAPADAPAGNASLLLVASPVSNPTIRTTARLVAQVAPRLGAPNIEVRPGEAIPGTATLSVHLASTANTAQELLVSLAQPAWGTAPTQVKLAAGEQRDVAVGLLVPRGKLPGAQPVSVQVADSQGKVLSTATATLQILRSVDGTTAWQAVRGVPAPLGVRDTEYLLAVTNAGNVPVVATLQVLGLDLGLETRQQDTNGTIEVGATVLLPLVVRSNASAPGIGGRVGVRLLDALGAERVLPSVALPDLDAAPDLTVVDVDVRGEPHAGRPVGIDVLVRNDGKLAAAPTRLFASFNGDLVEVLAVPAIAPGQTVRVNLTWTFEDAGRFSLAFLADGEGTLAEADDDDNGRTIDVRVGKPSLPDRVRGAPAPAPWLAGAAIGLAFLLARRRR